MSGTVHVYGASYATAEPIKATIAAATHRSVVLHGIVGATIGTWSQHIAAPGAHRGDDVLVLELGGNGVPTADAIRDADGRLRATGARVRWIVFRDWPDAQLRAKRMAAARAVRASGVDVFEVPGPVAGVLSQDRAHLTGAGYAHLGADMVRALDAATSRGGFVRVGVLAVLALVAWAVGVSR